jgi:hypothetical protein
MEEVVGYYAPFFTSFLHSPSIILQYHGDLEISFPPIKNVEETCRNFPEARSIAVYTMDSTDWNQDWDYGQKQSDKRDSMLLLLS